ncbi:MAG TPA: hypothetical protein VF691_07190, partial [Cytophagaceae bacterium]
MIKKNFFLFFLYFPFSINAQDFSTIGKEFWIGYMENLDLSINDYPDFRLIISSRKKTNGFINIP